MCVHWDRVDGGWGWHGMRWDRSGLSYLVLGALVIRGNHVLRDIKADALGGIRRKSLQSFPLANMPLSLLQQADPVQRSTRSQPPGGGQQSSQTYPRQQTGPTGVIQELHRLAPLRVIGIDIVILLIITVLNPLRADEVPSLLDALDQLGDGLFVFAVVV